MSVALPAVRDVKWLTLEVCRQFQRGSCSRKDTECKFAHPPKSCHVVNGRVIACFDFLKGRCFRESCKYLHPPSHLKAHLEITGRNNLIQQKMATMLQQMHFVLPGSCLPSVSLGPGTGISHAPFVTPVSHGIGLLTTEMLPVNHQVILPSAPRVIVQTSDASHQKVLHSDKMEVCREFQRGSCCRRETDCRFAHPTDSTMIDSADNTVTVCMDHVRGNCNREKCRYFHPTAHQHIQLQTGQTVSPSTATATNQSSAKILKRHLETSVDMAVPHALLAKRLALEQTGAAGGLSFQQLVSPTHLQTATALLPTEVPMMLGAPAVPAVSPYVAAATANASQIILK